MTALAHAPGRLALHTMSEREQHAALGLLAGHTYEAIARDTGTSRGFVYDVAVRHGLRKHEAKLRNKAERQRDAEAFLQRAINGTRKADALDFLKALPDNCVDLHVSSPPYNLSKNYDGSDDAMLFMEYIGWQMAIIAQIARTLKPGGTVVYQVGMTKDDDGNRYMLDELLSPLMRQAKLTFQDRIVWLSQHGATPKDHPHLVNRYETALVFSKGEQAAWNPNAIRIPQKYPGKKAFRGPNKGSYSGHPLGAHPSDVWHITHVMHNHPENTDHPAQFPIEFPRRAILAYTNVDGLVCDIFNGSGSTQIACLRTGRNFIGSDLAYEDLRVARLRGEHMEPVCPFEGVTLESMRLYSGRITPPVPFWDASTHCVNMTVPTLSPDDDQELCLELFGNAS